MVSGFFPPDKIEDGALSEIIPIGLMSCSLSSKKIIELNTPLALMLGHEARESLTDTPLGKILQVPADALVLFEDIINGKTPIADRYFALRKKDGSLFAGLISAALRMTPGGLVVDVAVRETGGDDVSQRESLARLERLMDGFLEAISRIVEMKDPYTASHHRRSADLAAAIARDIGLTDDEVEGIFTAAILHDLGKLCVPMEILSKPGGLSNTEFCFIRTHPQTGREILDKIEFRWPVGEYVLQHHERLDGSGYPHGTSGSNIRLESRIIAVADVVEAMTSRKPYRPAHSVDVALDHISDESGKLYDQDAVESCCTLFREKGYVQPEPINLEPVNKD
jgi:HD-GYP domain-containing protein (c-di-GMP phosphodiesterase class II)